MKLFFFGLILLTTQASFAAGCMLRLTLAEDAGKIMARLLDKAEFSDENADIEIPGNLNCSENFLLILKEGQKKTELGDFYVPIEYQYTLKADESDSYLESVSANAKLGGFGLLLSADGSTIIAIAKD